MLGSFSNKKRFESMPSFNPFHHWLGLRENVTNPHHYQLLGIKPADDKSVLTQAAKQRLLSLKNADRDVKELSPEQVDALIEKVRKRIVTAHKVLTDPDLRSEYDKKLKAKFAKAKSVPASELKKDESNEKKPDQVRHQMTKPVDGSETKKGSSTERKNPAVPMIPVSSEPSESDLLPPKIAQDVVHRPSNNTQPSNVTIDLPPETSQSTEKGTSAAEPAAIPMAVPIAQSPEAVPNNSSSPTVPSVAVAIPVDDMSTPVLPTAATLEPVTTPSNDFISTPIQKRPSSRRKRSMAVPIISSVLAVGGIIGLVLFLLNYQRFFSTPTVADNDTNTPAKVLNEQKDDLDTSNSLADVKPPQQTPADKPSAADDNSSSLSNVVDDPFTSSDDSKSTTAKPKTVRNLDFRDHVQFRQAMNGARWAMIRRDQASTIRSIQNAQGLFEGLSDDQRWSDEDAKLKELVESTNDVMKLLEGFWTQVVTSAESLQGGAEIEVGGSILGFVEARKGLIILRNAGANVPYAYEFLPAGLAKRIAEMGAKEDVPTFNMQLAAFYAVHVPIDKSYSDKAISLAEKAEADGHDPTPIIQYVENQLDSIGVDDSKVEWPDDAVLGNQVDQAKKALQVRSVVGMTPVAARSLVNAIFDMVSDYDASLRPGLFGLGVRAAIQSGDAQLAFDVVREAAFWTTLDQNKILMNALQRIAASKKLDARRARNLIEAVLKEGKAAKLDSPPMKRMINNAVQLAEQHQLVDLQRRLASLSK